MKTIVNLFLLIGLFVTGTVQAQRISPKMSVRLNTPQKLSIKTPTQDCKETLRIKVEGGRVHTPQHTPTDKVKSWSSNGHFFIRAVKPIKEGGMVALALVINDLQTKILKLLFSIFLHL